MGVVPDVVTDQTSAHDPLSYMPHGMTFEAARSSALAAIPTNIQRRALQSMALTARRCWTSRSAGSVVFDYGNNLRQRAYDAGVKNAFDYPGFVPAYIRPLFCEGKGPFRWVALSGDPQDIYRTDRGDPAICSRTMNIWRAGSSMAQRDVEFQGLPARICWLGYGERAKAGLAFNELVASGEVKAPIVIGRDHLDAGSVASPNRETEGDARWLGCDLRLGDSECADQCSGRRDVGQLPSWRRRGHRLQPARRTGDRGGWHAGSRAAAWSAC